MREPPEPPMTAYNEEEEDDDDDEGREECVVGLRMMEADVEDSGLGREMKNKSANAGKQGTRWDGMGWAGMRFGWTLDNLLFAGRRVIPRTGPQTECIRSSGNSKIIC